MSEGPGAGSGNSSAGSAGVMQDGDQRNVSKRDIEFHHRHHLGNIKAFINADQKDKLKVVNRLAEEDMKDDEPAEQAAAKRDPTAPAIMHGNKPSRGAVIDAELKAEDEAILKKKGDAMPGKKY